jgi:hypothetical protein
MRIYNADDLRRQGGRDNGQGCPGVFILEMRTNECTPYGTTSPVTWRKALHACCIAPPPIKIYSKEISYVFTCFMRYASSSLIRQCLVTSRSTKEQVLAELSLPEVVHVMDKDHPSTFS